jgi:uncharacterized protein (TIGR03435 family)
MKGILIGFGLLNLAGSACFGQANGAQLSFEVASVRLSRPLPLLQMIQLQRRTGGPETKDPVHVRWDYITLEAIIDAAYAQRYQQVVTDLKDRSFLADRYDIIANVPPGATLNQLNIMMQNLLAERFKLVVHHEMRPIPVYVLEVAKGGLKMKESPQAPAKPLTSPPAPQRVEQLRVDADGFPQVPPGQTIAIVNSPDGHVRVTGKGQELTCPPPRSLAVIPYCDNIFVLSVLGSAPGGRIIVDKTGLTRKYDLTLDYLQTAGAGLSADGGETGVNLFNALEQQLGLKLVDTKEPFDVLVIDHVEKPTEN